MISRRALFGIGAGAATAALVPMPAKPEVIVGMDFGTNPAMVEFEFSKSEFFRIASQQFPDEFKMVYFPEMTEGYVFLSPGKEVMK